ncbi:MAG: hypothetical protein N2486_06710 [Caloramator sp.]|nr:hypothetical protein [Caloramator sp.]
MYLILRVTPYKNLKSGQLFLNQNSTEIIVSKFPEIQRLTNKNIRRAFAYYYGNSIDKKVYPIIVNDINVSSKGIIIKYNIVLKNEDYFTSDSFSKSLYYYLISEGKIKKAENAIPEIILLDNNAWMMVLNNMNKNSLKKYEDDIESMFEQNNWEGIYKKFKSFDNMEQSDYWNNPNILSKIGYAITKLSYLNDDDKNYLNNVRNKEKSKEKILMEKKKLREEAETIFNRCIKIDPDNKARYLTNLAYMYYHYIQDVINNKKFKLESLDSLLKYFKKAENYFKTILNIDNKRIKELYRLGYLMTECYEEMMGNKFDKNDANKKKIHQMKREGIEYFNRVIKIWRTLPEHEQKRCRYEYLSSLYNIAKYNQEILKFFWYNVKKKLQGIKIDSVFSYNYIDSKQSLLCAKGHLEECFKNQYGLDIDMVIDRITTKDIVKTYDNWKIEAVDLFYRLGLLYFMIYWYLIDKNCKDVNKLNSYLYKSQRCYELSLDLNWKENKTMQRDYIEEKLARFYITVGQYDKAQELLLKYKDKYKNNNAKKYILDTLDLAILLNDNKKAM